jgi:hypothetical protein
MTVAPLEPVTRPTRITPAPRVAPPFDDELALTHERHLYVVPGQRELPLEWVLPTGLPARPDLPLVLLQGGADDADEEEDQDDFGPLPTPRSELPAPGPWAGRLVQAVVEVIGGDRPLAQLVRWTHEDVYEQLKDVAVLRRSTWPRQVRASVRSVHVAEPADGVAEVSAVVFDGVRARAFALRLEGADGRWSCTSLMLG